jgi:hypothetical protein
MIEYAIASGLIVSAATTVFLHVRNYRVKPNGRTRERRYFSRLANIFCSVSLSLRHSL